MYKMAYMINKLRKKEGKQWNKINNSKMKTKMLALKMNVIVQKERKEKWGVFLM